MDFFHAFDDIICAAHVRNGAEPNYQKTFRGYSIQSIHIAHIRA